MRHRWALLALDLCLISLATLCALFLRDNFETRPEQILALLPYLGLTLVVAAPVLTAFGSCQSIWRFTAMADYLRVVAATILIVTSAVALGFFINRLEGVARSLPIIQTFLMVFGLVGVRVFARLRHSARTRGPAVPRAVPEQYSGSHDNIVLVGINLVTELYLRSVAEFAKGSVKVAGLLETDQRHTGRLFQGHEILGSAEQVAIVLRELEVHGVLVDRIVVTLPFQRLPVEAREALLEVEKNSSIRLEFFAEQILAARRSEPAADIEGDDAAFSIRTGELAALAQRPYWRIKRVLDVVGAACAIVVLAPLVLLVAMLVTVEYGLPITFWQQRPGAGGRPFRLYKFRTMNAAHDHQGQRIPDNDRPSPIGRFLRRTRLDELPQLYNILVGHMSFVGPRPLLPSDQPPAFAVRLLVRPGLTGWAQVNGGRELSCADKAVLDVWYIKNASVGLELRVLVLTMRMIFLGERPKHNAVRLAWRQLGLDWMRVASADKVDAPVPPLRNTQGGETREQLA